MILLQLITHTDTIALDGSPLDECLASRRDGCLHNTANTRYRHPCCRRDSNPQSLQSRVYRRTSWTPQALGLASVFLTPFSFVCIDAFVYCCVRSFVPTIQVFFWSVRHFYSAFTYPNVTISVVIFCFSSKVRDPFPVLVNLNNTCNVRMT